MGLLWNREELSSTGKQSTLTEIKEVRVTLAELLAPELRKHLLDFIGKSKDKSGRPVQELGRLDREKFLDVYRQATQLRVL